MNLEDIVSSAKPPTIPQADVTRNEEVRLRCLSAKKLEDAVEYDGAREVLGDL